MTQNVIRWATIREEVSKTADKVAELEQLSGWSRPEIEEMSEGFLDQYRLKSEEEAVQSLLEIFKMREHVRISDALSEDLQFALLKTMWLRRWSIDETKAALADLRPRLKLTTHSTGEQINILLEIAGLYGGIDAPKRWPGSRERGQCAELMWLMHWSEEKVYEEMLQARERFGYSREDVPKALDALREIELLFRHTGFEEALGEESRRKAAEVMWLRDWSLDKVLLETAALQANLNLNDDEEGLDTLYQICLLSGGKERPNEFTRALGEITRGAPLSPEQKDKEMTLLAEYMWLGQYSLAQAVSKLGRFARVNQASLHETLDVMLSLERKRYREVRASGASRTRT